MLKTLLFFLPVSILFTHNSFGQEVSRWHLPEGAKARLGEGGAVEITYSPDGKRLAVVSRIGIWLYETASYREVAFFPELKDLYMFSLDSKTLVGMPPETTVVLWDAETGETQHTFKHKGSVDSLAFSPDGTTIATASADATVLLYEVPVRVDR